MRVSHTGLEGVQQEPAAPYQARTSLAIGSLNLYGRNLKWAWLETGRCRDTSASPGRSLPDLLVGAPLLAVWRPPPQTYQKSLRSESSEKNGIGKDDVYVFLYIYYMDSVLAFLA